MHPFGELDPVTASELLAELIRITDACGRSGVIMSARRVVARWPHA